MGRSKGWAAEPTGRTPRRSPGRPQVNQRQTRQAFWGRIAAGLSSEDAAQACGVSQPLGPRWFRDAGGMSPIALVPLSGRYLSFSEREEIALLRAQQCGVREIARQLERSPSTISRELRRNAATRGVKRVPAYGSRAASTTRQSAAAGQAVHHARGDDQSASA
jgi:DNA-binding CsgD family transcriptional regulator